MLTKTQRSDPKENHSYPYGVSITPEGMDPLLTAETVNLAYRT